MERAADEVVAWVYLLRCLADDSLYTGWTVDLTRRLAAHQAGKGSRYTRSRLPVELAVALPMRDAAAPAGRRRASSACAAPRSWR